MKSLKNVFNKIYKNFYKEFQAMNLLLFFFQVSLPLISFLTHLASGVKFNPLFNPKLALTCFWAAEKNYG